MKNLPQIIKVALDRRRCNIGHSTEENLQILLYRRRHEKVILKLQQYLTGSNAFADGHSINNVFAFANMSLLPMCKLVHMQKLEKSNSVYGLVTF